MSDQSRVRIKDIAEELGLSTATVSNVIHGKTGRVSDATIRRVQQCLEERRYIPSMAGILLSRSASGIIGVFINDHEKYEGHTLEDAFIASALNHLAVCIEDSGCVMMVRKATDPNGILTFSSMWNMDGVVVIGFCLQDYRYLREHMRIPFVVYDGLGEDPDRVVNITVDNRDGGRQVGSLFRKCRCRQAVCLADNETGVDKARIAGFREAFGTDRTQTLLIPMKRQERFDFYRAHREVFQRIDGVFAVSDVYAAEIMAYLASEGRRVPEDIVVAGFDDMPLCGIVHPTLTSVRQDNRRRAEVAVRMLKELKEHQETVSTVCLPVTLIERDSTRHT